MEEIIIKKKIYTKHFYFILFYFILFLSFVYLGPHQRHMEVPRLEVESKLYLPAYATATAIPDPSCVCDLHHSSWQYRILNPLTKARDQTHNLMVPSRIHFCCTTTGTTKSDHLLSSQIFSLSKFS